jgi:hypothetical protein
MKAACNDLSWNLELGTWNLELGTWNLELGTWNLRIDKRNVMEMVFGATAGLNCLRMGRL